MEAKKVYSDSLGIQSDGELNDWLEIGVLGEVLVNGEIKELPIYLEKVLITDSITTFQVNVKEKPIKAGIDPMHKFVDRDSDDNLISVSILKENIDENEKAFRELIRQGFEEGNMNLNVPDNIDENRGMEIIKQEVAKKFGGDVKIKTTNVDKSD